jgi:hypothetical protein
MRLFYMWLLYGSEIRAPACRVEQHHDERRYYYGYYYSACYSPFYGSCNAHPPNILRYVVVVRSSGSSH